MYGGFVLLLTASAVKGATSSAPTPMPHAALDPSVKFQQYRQGSPQVQLDHAAIFRGIGAIAGLCICSICFMCYHGSQARGTNEWYTYGTPRAAGDESSSSSESLLGVGGDSSLLDGASSDSDNELRAFVEVEATEEPEVEDMAAALVSEPLSDAPGIELLEFGANVTAGDGNVRRRP